MDTYVSVAATGTKLLFIKQFADFVRWETTDSISGGSVKFRITGVGKGTA